MSSIRSKMKALLGESTDHVVPEEPCLTCEADNTPCPECGEKALKYEEGAEAWSCGTCGWREGGAETDMTASKEEPRFNLAEMRRLAGIDVYADRRVASSEVGRAFMGRLEREKAGIGGAHSDWKLEDKNVSQCMDCGKQFAQPGSAKAAKSEGCPRCGGEDIQLVAATERGTADIWNPDAKKDEPVHPTGGAKPPEKKPSGTDALLKALHCPPGKEPKMIYGRPSCAAKSP